MTPSSPVSISLGQFTKAVQTAVEQAVKRHPKFKALGAPDGVTISFLIRGIPLPEAILSQATIAETQAFANDVAGHISSELPKQLLTGGGAEGAILSIGRHLILGIPPLAQAIRLKG